MATEYSEIIIDMKRVLRELEDIRHQLQVMERKLDAVTNHMTTQQLNKRVTT